MGARQQYANTDKLNFLRTDSGIPYSRSWPRPQIHLSHSTNSVEQYSPKILRDDVTVQLIVSFAAIREILKKEIYRRDKPRLLLVENKGGIMTVAEVMK